MYKPFTQNLNINNQTLTQGITNGNPPKRQQTKYNVKQHYDAHKIKKNFSVMLSSRKVRRKKKIHRQKKKLLTDFIQALVSISI